MLRILIISFLLITSVGCSSNSDSKPEAVVSVTTEQFEDNDQSENVGGALELHGELQKAKLLQPAVTLAPVYVDEATFTAPAIEVTDPTGTAIEHHPLVGKPTLAPPPTVNQQDFYSVTEAAQSVLVTVAAPTPENDSQSHTTKEVVQHSEER